MKIAKYIAGMIFIGIATYLVYHFYFKGIVSIDEIPKEYAEVIISDQNIELKECFAKKNIPYPPDEIHLLAFKNEKILELWANSKNTLELVKTFAFTGYSGKSGPKLEEGDKQIPEGVYKVVMMNPNSRYHLSMLLNYPNKFDSEKAIIDGRDSPGSDICIHGSNWTIGCIPVGDEAIEEIYYLIEDLGMENVVIKIFPNDARNTGKFFECEVCPKWIKELYSILKIELEQYK